MAKHNIKAVQRENLDVEAYDECVSRASQSKIYARSWYLDSMADQWYALVKGDYEAVMPLPIRKKWGFSYVYQPVMMQQLGVFPSTDSHDDFYSMAISRHLHLDYTFNAAAPSTLLHTPKPNFILKIDGEIEDLKANASSNRKRDLKKAGKNDLSWRAITDWIAISRLVSEQLSSGPYSGVLERLETLFNVEKPNGFIQACGLFKENECIFFLLYGLDAGRIYYLLPVAISQEAQKVGAATHCIFKLIELYKADYSIFDFEGSSIPGVRRFYESFGAQIEPYYHFTKTFLHFMKHAR